MKERRSPPKARLPASSILPPPLRYGATGPPLLGRGTMARRVHRDENLSKFEQGTLWAPPFKFRLAARNKPGIRDGRSIVDLPPTDSAIAAFPPPVQGRSSVRARRERPRFEPRPDRDLRVYGAEHRIIMSDIDQRAGRRASLQATGKLLDAVVPAHFFDQIDLALRSRR